MGNVESRSDGPLGAVDSLKHRLQSLEETVRSIEVAHHDSQGHDRFPAPDSADVCLHGARLTCTPGVRIITGPVIGEVTANSAVILLEVDIPPGLGLTARVSCFVSLTDDACPNGRVVFKTSLHMPSRRPRAFRIGGGISTIIGPGRTYVACFGGVGVEDAYFRIGRFRTPSACFEPKLRVTFVSEDRPDRLAPGEPCLWRVLRERVAVSGENRQCYTPVDLVVHAGGQVWMGDAFEDAWELLKRRAAEPLLSAGGGWQEAQEEATERLREAMRRAWNLPDKRAVLSSVANLMLCGVADVHPELETHLARISSLPREGIGGGEGSASKKGRPLRFDQESCETRALHATVRASRRVYFEYQGQLLWKAVSIEKDGDDDLTLAFEAEEKGVEETISATRHAERDVALKQKKVALAEEALRRAKAAGKIPKQVGLQAAEERMSAIRKDAKAARVRRTALAKRAAPTATAAAVAAERASQGAFLNLGGAIGLALLDNTWARVRWDGKICIAAGGGAPRSEETTIPVEAPFMSPGAWEALDSELSSDSEMRLLCVVTRFAILGGESPRRRDERATNYPGVASEKCTASNLLPPAGGDSKFSDKAEESRPLSTASASSKVSGSTGTWLTERDRLLNRLFAWKSGEAWREVVIVCGAAQAADCEGREALRSACELELTDSERPGCTIRQLVTGPITNTPASVAHTLARGDTNDGRFSYRLPTTQEELLTCISMAEKQTTEAHGALTSAYVKESHASSSQEIGDRQRGPSKAAPGWDDGAVRRDGDDGNRDTKDGSRNSSRADTRKTSTKGGTGGSSFTSDNRQCSPSSQSMRRQAQPVSADGKRSFLEALLDGGHSPATAIAAGLDPAENARGVRASMVAEAVKISMAGGTLVLGPVMGRVTQSSAIVLVEVGNTAAVGCVVTDSVTGGQHRQARILESGQPYAFFFEMLREGRHYTVSFDGVEDAGARTGAFTTLKAWPDRREPPALRAAKRLSADVAASGISPAFGSLNGDDSNGNSDVGNSPVHCEANDAERSSAFDLRLLFVSGTGRPAAGARARSCLARGAQGRDERCTSDSDVEKLKGREGGMTPVMDMWGVVGRELWRPWPQVDVVVHTGSQIYLGVAMREALAILSAVEAAEEGSEERDEAEEMAMERIRDAYRFQWSLPGARACLSCGSHLMLRGEGDLGLPQLETRGCSAYSPSASWSGVIETGSGRVDENTSELHHGEHRRGFLGTHASVYARITLAGLAAQAFSDYQRQLWDPLSVPVGVDMNDVGYARGGAAIDSSGIAPGGCRHGCLEVLSEEGGEWHFHAFGETVGLFALDIGHGSAGLQRDEGTPLVSHAQWSSLEQALSIEEIQAMIIVGDTPFVSDSVLDARAKARHPSNAHLRQSWPFHGGELLRLVKMLVDWKAAGAMGGQEAREVTLIGGGLRCPLETVLRASTTSTTITQNICGPFSGAPPCGGRLPFEFTGHLDDSISYSHRRIGSDGMCYGSRSLILHEHAIQQQNHEQQARDTPSRLSQAKDVSPLKPSDNVHSNISEGDGNGSGTNDDPYAGPSCVLVRCEVSGIGTSAHLCVQSRHFTSASWAAWCDSGDHEASASVLNHDTPSPSVEKPTGESLPPPPGKDFGRPRSVPRWAAWGDGDFRGVANADRGMATASRSRSPAAAVSTADVLQILARKGPAGIVVEAFERILDVEDDDEDEALAAVRGGAAISATRRVFDCMVWVYEHDACAELRTLCPTRPSPIVVRRLLLGRHEEEGPSPTTTAGSSSADQDSAQHRRGGSITRNEAHTDGAKSERKAKAADKCSDIAGGDSKRMNRGGENGMTLSAPFWLFSSLPFHDDDSFAAFLCEVLRGSESLASIFLL